MERVYSLNLAAWLVSKGYVYKIYEDFPKGKYYFVFVDDISAEKERYKENRELQNFLSVYKQLKKEIAEKRMKNYLAQ